MEKPINFLTARGATMLEVAGVARSMTQMLEYVRDQTLAAAEAKVRGECADTLRDMESASHGYRRSSEEWQRRAERAEADANEVREAFAKDKAVASFRTAVRAAVVAEMVAGVEKMPPRDAAYDDTMRLACVEFFRADVTDYLHGLAPETDPNG
jgi:Lon protease-like protein